MGWDARVAARRSCVREIRALGTSCPVGGATFSCGDGGWRQMSCLRVFVTRTRAETRIRRVAATVWGGTASSEGAGLLVRGREYQPLLREDVDARVLGAIVRLARLADSVAMELRECPDPAVRRSAAVLAARAHPVLAAFDER